MTPRINSEDLIDSVGVAELLGLSQRNSVSTYLNRYEDFPKPTVNLGRGRVRLWLRQDIVRWHERRSSA